VGEDRNVWQRQELVSENLKSPRCKMMTEGYHFFKPFWKGVSRDTAKSEAFQSG
jgi:hypothetical protein